MWVPLYATLRASASHITEKIVLPITLETPTIKRQKRNKPPVEKGLHCAYASCVMNAWYETLSRRRFIVQGVSAEKEPHFSHKNYEILTLPWSIFIEVRSGFGNLEFNKFSDYAIPVPLFQSPSFNLKVAGHRCKLPNQHILKRSKVLAEFFGISPPPTKHRIWAASWCFGSISAMFLRQQTSIPWPKQ